MMLRSTLATSASDVAQIRLVLKPDKLAPGKARAGVSKLQSRIGPRYGDVVLVISELVTNSVRHSATVHPIEMTIQVSDAQIRLEVSDRGSGFVPVDSMRIGGLGLIIVDRIAASWGVILDDRCTVWVEVSKVLENEMGPVSGLGSPTVEVNLQGN
jgi:anti-sigma regulatory factor (Ser/Thr protein kinase)